MLGNFGNLFVICRHNNSTQLIALQCDLRIVAGRAKLGATFSRLGIHSGMGITKLLPEAVGDQLGRELLFTGRIFRGEEAAQAGFALKAVEFDQVLPEAMDLARRIAGAAPLAVQWIKRTLKDPSLKDQDAVMEAESAAQASLMQTRDAVEGLRAGVEGREPRFEGR